MMEDRDLYLQDHDMDPAGQGMIDSSLEAETLW